MKKLNSVTKYTIVICIGIAVFNLIFGTILASSAARDLRTQINERMLDISNTAAAMINGDDLARLTAEDAGSPEYQRVMDTLKYFQDNIELEYIYCIMPKGEKEFTFGPDPTVEDPGEFGSPIVYTDALYNASKGTAGVDEVPYEDEWGEFYSAYTPVYDSAGKVAGIVAVDFSAKWYRERLMHLGLIVGGFIAFALIISVLLAILITSQYRKFFMALVRKMNDLSLGIETLINEVVPERADEHHQLFAASKAGSGMSDSMNILGEKIGVMQESLTREIDIIRSHAYLDGLTGMNNRTAYMEYLQILEKKLTENPDMVFTVVVFDINQLKVINDDFGHDAGDKLIIEISGAISEAFEGTRIYRTGGDEFVAILDEPDPSEKIAALRAIVARKNLESPTLHDPGIEIGLSVGTATYDPSIDRTYSEVFHRADNAMYADKRAFYQTHEDRRKKK